MKFISHRGNISGMNISEENDPLYISKALEQGYDVEIDVWWNDAVGFILGHDNPVYSVDESFFDNEKLWCHTKNDEAFSILFDKGVRCFWHTNENFILTSKRDIWVYSGYPLLKNSIAVLPENTVYDVEDLKRCLGVCSDNIEYYKNIIGE